MPRILCATLAACACTSGVMDQRCADADACDAESVGDASSSAATQGSSDDGDDGSPSSNADSGGSDGGPAPGCTLDADCDDGPAPTCQDETRSVAAGLGRCEAGACTFEPVIESCLAGCDPDTGACRHDVWLPLPSGGQPSGRIEHTLVWLDGRAVVWGGLQGDGTAVDDGAAYDPTTDTWTALEPDGAPSPRALHSAVAVGSRMVVYGGYDDDGTLASGGSYDFDLQAGSPMAAPPATTMARYGHGVAVVDGRMIVVGGWDDGDVAGSTANHYVIASDSWVPPPTSRVSVRRSPPSATPMGLIAWGGQDFGGDPSKGGLALARGLWSDTPLIGAPLARSRHTAVWTARR
ncbi:MAG: kelch repeat-containing protein [Nannocystaceae bacterium]